MKTLPSETVLFTRVYEEMWGEAQRSGADKNESI